MTPTLTRTFTPTQTPSFTQTPTPTFTPTATSTPTPYLHLSKLSNTNLAHANDTLTYTLDYSNPGSSSAMNVTLVDNLPTTAAMQYVSGTASNGGIYDPSSNTLTWVFPDVLRGSNLQVTYQCSVQVLAGENSPVINCAKLLFPAGQVSACNSVSVIGSYVIQMAIYNSAGEIVKTYTTFETNSAINSLNLSSNTLSNGSQAIQISTNGQYLGTWDGTNSAGQIVTNGSYFIKISSTNPFGVTSTVSQTVSVDLSPSTLTVLVFNSAGEIVKHITESEILAMIGGSGLSISDFNISRIQLSSNVIVPNYSGSGATNSVLTITLASGQSFTWNGTGDNGLILPNGSYFLEVQSTKQGAQGNQEITRVVNIEGGSSAINGAELWPNPVHVGQSPQAEFRINTDAVQAVATDVKIYTLAGELVKPILYNQPGDPSTVLWNIGGANLASGTYIAVIELNSANGTIGHKILKVVIIH